MNEETLGFDEFAKKWVPQPPAWRETTEVPSWAGAASENERRQAYMDRMQQTGADTLVFSRDLQDKLKRDAAAGVPILTILDGLLQNPEISDREAIAVLFQRVFGVPASRARFITSWQPANRSSEAKKVLERVALCVADAHRAGLWSTPRE